MNFNQIIKWNNYHESLIKRWSSMAKTYSTIHTLSASHYKRIDKFLGIPVILLGAITASSIFSSHDEEHFPEWKYINGGMALLMTALTGISNFLSLKEKINSHNIAAYKYLRVSMDIDTILSFTRQNRIKDPQSFIYEIKKEILEIKENCSQPQEWIMKDFIKRFEKSIINTNTKVCKKDEEHSYIINENPISLSSTQLFNPPPIPSMTNPYTQSLSSFAY